MLASGYGRPWIFTGSGALFCSVVPTYSSSVSYPAEVFPTSVSLNLVTENNGPLCWCADIHAAVPVPIDPIISNEHSIPVHFNPTVAIEDIIPSYGDIP